ncbi:MAG TPA: formyl transferase [Pyrinomonadaceae bacterium]|jgi:methionyl-tRNA formyltransferase|nr:formyl transferase [Pyrinomonadaceae bacterium]
MRLVLFSRVPRWYSFRQDRFVKRLVADGHEIAAVVVERTKTLKSIREWMFKLGPRVFFEKAVSNSLRLTGLRRAAAVGPASPTTADAAARRPLPESVNPPVHLVDSHNSPACVELVRSLRPDVIVLRGCGIVRKQILDIPRVGTINPHYALLPAYRGMDVTEWSALHGDPVAVSVHTVNEGVDTGTVLASRLVKVERGDTVGMLRDKSAALAVDLIAETLANLEAGRALPRRAEPGAAGRQYFVMHPRLRRLADERLKRID